MIAQSPYHNPYTDGSYFGVDAYTGESLYSWTNTNQTAQYWDLNPYDATKAKHSGSREGIYLTTLRWRSSRCNNAPGRISGIESGDPDR